MSVEETASPGRLVETAACIRGWIRYWRNVAARKPHTLSEYSEYRRPGNDEQFPRWLQHRLEDNWNARTVGYIDSPGGKPNETHFYRNSKFRWKPPIHQQQWLAELRSSIRHAACRGVQLARLSPDTLGVDELLYPHQLLMRASRSAIQGALLREG
jgi:hypothetical protein